jgi:hypothetical protein
MSNHSTALDLNFVQLHDLATQLTLSSRALHFDLCQ